MEPSMEQTAGSGAAERRLGLVPDAEFVALLRERDPSAWGELRGFLRRLAASKAWGAVDESHATDDYVQLACLRLWKAISRPGLDVGSVSLKAYLAVTMQNLVREVHRRRAGVTHVPRGSSGAVDGASSAGPRHRVDLDEAQRVFDHQGVPDSTGVAAGYESRAADAFAVLESLAGGTAGGGRHVRKIAARLLELTRVRDAAGLVTTLDTNLFQLLYGDTSRWSERKRTKHRVRLNRFREAFIRALVEYRHGQRGENP
jgi:DNA-directed RNA polymerase specialized sigma24 family protein